MNFAYLAISCGTFVVAYMSGSVEVSRQRQFIGLCLFVMSHALVYCQGTVFSFCMRFFFPKTLLVFPSGFYESINWLCLYMEYIKI
jgi:hypothetical protein